ncbi:hypothetical protein Ahia01_000453200 [Argonauta hians]
MLKFLVLLSVCIIGANAECDSRTLLNCLTKQKYNPNMSAEHLCGMLKNDEGCLKENGCTANEMSLQPDNLYNSLCGKGSTCDVVKAGKCFANTTPNNGAAIAFIKTALTNFNTCLAKASCKPIPMQHSAKPMCFELD